MEQHKSKRSLRVALVMGAAVAGTALVGWGGLAAWQAYTDNAGNSVAAGTLSHAQNTSCLSQSTAALAEQSGNTCTAVIAVTNADPTTWTGTNGVIKIDNTGSLNSTFSMGLVGAPSGGLCADLQLKVTDKNTTAPDTGTVYATGALSSLPTTNLYSNAATPSLTWSPSGTAGSGSGATGNTFTLAVTPATAFATNTADEGASCTFSVLFTQASA